MLLQGAKKSLSSSDWSDAKAAWISAVVAGGLAALAACIGIPLLKKWVSKSFDRYSTLPNTASWSLRLFMVRSNRQALLFVYMLWTQPRRAPGHLFLLIYPHSPRPC